jgi:hypothetical protein
MLNFLTSCGCTQNNRNPSPAPSPAAAANPAACDAVTSATTPAGGEYKKIEQQLHVINLVNSLHLTDEQLKALLPIAEESEKMEKDLNEAMKAKYSEVISSMKDLREHLLDHEDATDRQQNRLDKCSMPIYGKIADHKDRMKVLTGKVKSILNVNQLEILLTYEPCIVPQQRDSQPERIGGYSGGENFAEKLDEARNMKDDEYKKYKSDLLDKQRIFLKTFNDQKQIEAVINQMGKALDEARKLPEVEYEIKRKELSSINMPSRVKPGATGQEEEVIITRYLLNPYMKTIITHKINNKGKQGD